MNGASSQPRPAVQPPAQKQALLPRQQSNLQEAVTRAFEVAQVIARAVCADTGESLEQFMFRVMARLFESNTGTSLRISWADASSTTDRLQVHDNAITGDDLSTFPSGHSIWLVVRVESKEECEEACKYVQEYGFVPGSDPIFGKTSHGLSGFEKRDRSELDSHSLADCACSILRSMWGIKAKKEIVCYFDHEEEHSVCPLQSEEDLRKCLAAVSAGEPLHAGLVLYTKNETQILRIWRGMHGTLLIRVSPTIVAEKIHSRIEALLEKAGYIRDVEYGDDIWRGSEDADFKVSVLSDVLRTAEIIVESDKLRAELRLKHRFR